MKSVNPAYVEELKRVVKQSPYPRHLSMVLEHIEIDRANIVIRLAEHHLQPYGIVHGGVIATIIDTATFWAAFLRVPEPDGLVNIDLKLNYFQPVVDGRLTAKGSCIWSGKTISYSEARVFDDHEKLVAHGTSTLMVLKGKGLQMKARKFLGE